MNKRILMMGLMVFLASACQQAGYVNLAPKSGETAVEATVDKSIRTLDDIKVFDSEADVPGEYDKLGIISWRGWQANTKVIMSWLKKGAYEKGGNAIILKSIKPKGLFTYSYGTGEAIAIKLKSK